MKNDTENLITRKIKYSFSTNEEKLDFLNIQKQYSNVLHFTYNRIFENNKLKTKELTKLQHSLKNINLNSHLLSSVIFDSKSLIKKNKDKQIIFGGKKLFFDRLKGNINKDEFKIKKLSPVTSIGETIQKGNRLFSIIDENTIIFKHFKNQHFKLNLKVSKSCKKELLKLQELMNNKEIPVTVKLDSEYIYLTFDYNKVKEEVKFNHVKNRIMSIDQNPNYIGWSIVDWKNENNYSIVDKGIISLKPLNDIYFKLNKLKNVDSKDRRRIYNNNKRRYEVSKIGQMLVKIAKHFQCQIFSVEDLKIKNSDKEKGKRFNSLCNNLWCRNNLYSQLRKYSNLYGIKFLEVISNYSSFIGNLVYRKEYLPDMVLSSIEIGRRAYEFYHQYILKDKKIEKNIILPKLELVKLRINQSLEELKYSKQFNTLTELYKDLKKSKQKYRFSLEDIPLSKFSSNFVKNQKKTYTVLYRFL